MVFNFIYNYHLGSRWRNSHVLVYHGPLLSHLLGVAPSCAIYFHCGAVVTCMYTKKKSHAKHSYHSLGIQTAYHQRINQTSKELGYGAPPDVPWEVDICKISDMPWVLFWNIQFLCLLFTIFVSYSQCWYVDVYRALTPWKIWESTGRGFWAIMVTKLPAKLPSLIRENWTTLLPEILSS